MSTLSSALVSKSILTTDAGGTITITGAGFTPKLAVFFINSRNEQYGCYPGMEGGIGAAASSSQEFACCWMNESEADPINCGRAMINDGCIYVWDETSSSIVLECNLSSFNSDGCVLNVVTCSANTSVEVAFLGGDAIEDVYVGTDSTGSTTADIVNTDVGFALTSGLFITSWPTSFDSVVTSVRGCLSMFSSVSDRRCVVFSDTDNAATVDANQRTLEDAVLALDSAGSIAGEADLDSIDANGFTLSVSNAFPADLDFGIIAIKGPQVYFDEYEQDTSSGSENFPSSPMSFAPKAGFFLTSYPDSSGGWYVNKSDITMAFGFAGGSDEAVCFGLFSEDGATEGECSRFIEGDEVVNRFGPSEALESSLFFDSFNASDITFNKNDAESSNRRHGVMLLGDSITTVGGGTSLVDSGIITDGLIGGALVQ